MVLIDLTSRLFKKPNDKRKGNCSSNHVSRKVEVKPIANCKKKTAAANVTASTATTNNGLINACNESLQTNRALIASPFTISSGADNTIETFYGISSPTMNKLTLPLIVASNTDSHNISSSSINDYHDAAVSGLSIVAVKKKMSNKRSINKKQIDSTLDPSGAVTVDVTTVSVTDSSISTPVSEPVQNKIAWKDLRNNFNNRMTARVYANEDYVNKCIHENTDSELYDDVSRFQLQVNDSAKTLACEIELYYRNKARLPIVYSSHRSDTIPNVFI